MLIGGPHSKLVYFAGVRSQSTVRRDNFHLYLGRDARPAESGCHKGALQQAEVDNTQSTAKNLF